MPEETANFSFIMNDRFDLFNVSKPDIDARYTRKAFGLEMEKQTELLEKSYEYINISNKRHPNSVTGLTLQNKFNTILPSAKPQVLSTLNTRTKRD